MSGTATNTQSDETLQVGVHCADELAYPYVFVTRIGRVNMLDVPHWPPTLRALSADFSGPILKISACYEKCAGFITFLI